MEADDVKQLISQTLREQFPDLTLDVSLDSHAIATLRGDCTSWAQLVAVGHAAAKIQGVKNVVTELTVNGAPPPQKDYTPLREAGLRTGVIDTADVVIIGAGISGCAIARALSKYKLSVLVLEQSEDVATGATRANNGNIHPGHAAKPGTLKAKLNVRGNRMYTQWAQELGFELQRCGAIGGVTDERLIPALQQAYQVAKLNGVDGVELVDGARAKELEPGFVRNNDPVVAALWLPSMGLVEPYKVAVALAENAAQNGVRFRFHCAVADILRDGSGVTGVVTSQGLVHAKYVINCAGVYADDISAMAGDKSYTIHPRKGVIALLDNHRKPYYDSLAEVITLEDAARAKKNENTKGGGMCRTPEWHILMGPSATEIPDKEDHATTPGDLAYSMGLGTHYALPYGEIIRMFAGVRPADYAEDFIIEMSPVTDRFINVGGIQSPGLAAAPAVAELVEEILSAHLSAAGTPLVPDETFEPRREPPICFHQLSRAEQDALIQKDPRYGKIICRCETITEGEILDAIRSPIVPTTIDAIKRRTRAGMGRCQGGFCQPRVLELLARELGQDWVDIHLGDPGSQILLEGNRPQTHEEVRP